VPVALPASARSFSLNPPIWPLKPLVWPGQEAISAAEAVHLLGATPCNCQRAPDLRGHRRAHGVSVDSGLPWHRSTRTPDEWSGNRSRVGFASRNDNRCSESGISTARSRAQRTIGSGWREAAISEQTRSGRARSCEWCRLPFVAKPAAQRFCSRPCAGQWRGTQRKAIRPTLTCQWCSMTFRPTSSKARRFCGNPCAASWRMAQPERAAQKERLWKAGQAARRGRPRPDASRRMRDRNPMRDAATVAKMASSLQGRTWLSQRGGRGRLTAPQLLLAEQLALPTEFIIPTRPVAHLFASLPNWYAVDLACPPARLAIEVDARPTRRSGGATWIAGRRRSWKRSGGWC
jgi:hypothetical protein